MKRIDLYDAIIAIILIMVMIYVAETREKVRDDRIYYEQKFNRLDSLIQRRTHVDSLYRNHLEVCAFELREGIQFTYHN